MSFSSAERDRELCRNILEAFEYISRYTDGLSMSEFLMDSKTQDAVTMRLQQILECSIKLSSPLKAKLSIHWQSLVAMRNKISHSYVDIDTEIVWQAIYEFDEFKNLIAFCRHYIN